MACPCVPTSVFAQWSNLVTDVERCDLHRNYRSLSNGTNRYQMKFRLTIRDGVDDTRRVFAAIAARAPGDTAGAASGPRPGRRERRPRSIVPRARLPRYPGEIP